MRLKSWLLAQNIMTLSIQLQRATILHRGQNCILMMIDKIKHLPTFFLLHTLILVSLIFSLPVLAAAEMAEDTQARTLAEELSFRGFGTLGIARSSSNQADFVRDLSQPKGLSDGSWSARIDSILGGQINWQMTKELELVGQAVSRFRYNESRSPEIMWAFARWDMTPDIAVRAGRIGADFMMLADSRLVGYSYLTARPSSDFFGPLFFHHFDGADMSISKPVGEGVLRAKVFIGATHEKTADIQSVWNTSGSQVGGVVLDYWQGPLQLRANVAQIKFSNDLDVSPLPDFLKAAGTFLNRPSAFSAAQSLATKDTTSRFYSLGVVYEANGFQAQAMANCIRHEAGLLQNSCAGYALAGYRRGAITPYAGISAWKSSRRNQTAGLPNIPPFADLNAIYSSVMEATRSDQRTYTLGVRWDVKPNVAFKLQWDAIRGDSLSVFPVRDEQPGWNGRTNVISITSDFVF
jgi:hypothetical protein